MAEPVPVVVEGIRTFYWYRISVTLPPSPEQQQQEDEAGFEVVDMISERVVTRLDENSSSVFPRISLRIRGRISHQDHWVYLTRKLIDEEIPAPIRKRTIELLSDPNYANAHLQIEVFNREPNDYDGESSDEDVAKCNVCHHGFLKDDEIFNTEYCPHFFHPRCILDHLCTHHTCPSCHSVLPAEAILQSPDSYNFGGFRI